MEVASFNLPLAKRKGRKIIRAQNFVLVELLFLVIVILVFIINTVFKQSAFR